MTAASDMSLLFRFFDIGFYSKGLKKKDFETFLFQIILVELQIFKSEMRLYYNGNRVK